jgi:predicted transcriptional regulator
MSIYLCSSTLAESTKPRELNSTLSSPHHLKKGSGLRRRLFARGPDALLALRPLGEENPWRAEATVRYFSRIEPFGVLFKFLLLERDESLELDRIATGAAEQKFFVEQALALSAPEGLFHKNDALVYNLDCSEGTFRNLRQEAIERELVRREGSKHSTRYSLTDEGRMAVEKFKNVEKMRALTEQLNGSGKLKRNGQ